MSSLISTPPPTIRTNAPVLVQVVFSRNDRRCQDPAPLRIAAPSGAGRPDPSRRPGGGRHALPGARLHGDVDAGDRSRGGRRGRDHLPGVRQQGRPVQGGRGGRRRGRRLEGRRPSRRAAGHPRPDRGARPAPPGRAVRRDAARHPPPVRDRSYGRFSARPRRTRSFEGCGTRSRRRGSSGRAGSLACSRSAARSVRGSTSRTGATCCGRSARSPCTTCWSSPAAGATSATGPGLTVALARELLPGPTPGP